MDDIPSSPPTDLSSPESALAYYKSQYEQLEHELAEFQASSQELEAELEKDVEAAEKRERVLQEKVEGLGFEVDEWKVHTLPGIMTVTDKWLTAVVDEIQTIEVGSKLGAKHPPGRNHNASGFKQDAAASTPRYRSSKRRF
jgi:hypothetical protein